MRMWMVNPRIMCTKHLLGEHVEIHMLAGVLDRKRSISGFIKKNCLEPLSIRTRHAAIAEEMGSRGMFHASDLPPLIDILYLPQDEQKYKIDRKSAMKELLCRCHNCRRRNLYESLHS